MPPVTPIQPYRSLAALAAFFLALLSAGAQDAPHRALPPLPPPLGVPKPGPATDAPYAPQPILPGGVVVTLYPPGSPYLKMDRVREPEVYNMSQTVPGRINSIVNIHNPSIEVHTVDRGINTGAAVILAAGGGHNTLNVGSEAADFVPFFYNYGVNTIILRNRLRRDGYNPQTDEVNDALQSIRLVRAYAKEWNIDPNKIGIMGFSAGAELAAPSAVLFPEFDKRTATPATLWPASPPAPISSASSTPAPRPSPATAPRRPFPATSLPPSSPAAAPATASTPSGPSNTSPPCWPSAFPISKCTSMAPAAIPATPSPMAAT
ncbi:MAG TPA: alpha/beta hydrolase fold domain-containing protein [Bryobacteraceae bacterium]|nr:alpha/beta hydrolase fold domain-containing protein [Bryobacteraceae bacterium]